MTIDDIRENFELLDDWDDRYRYVIELGRTLEPMPDAEHSATNKVHGCASQVWLSKRVERSGADEPLLKYRGDSDAHIVRGLIAILLTLFPGTRRSKSLQPTPSRCSTNSDSATISPRNAQTACARWWNAFAPMPARPWPRLPEI